MIAFHYSIADSRHDDGRHTIVAWAYAEKHAREAAINHLKEMGREDLIPELNLVDQVNIKDNDIIYTTVEQ